MSEQVCITAQGLTRLSVLLAKERLRQDDGSGRLSRGLPAEA